jgi:cardiolipin synthase A/B
MTFRRAVIARAISAVAIVMTATACNATPSPWFTGRANVEVSTEVGAFTLVQEPEAGVGPVRDLIAAAKRSVRMTMYELASDEIVDSLLSAQRRGVQIQVLLDRAYHGGAVNSAAYQRLSSGGVDVKWAPPDTIDHQKTIAIDDATAAVGTGNLVSSRSPGRDAWVVDVDPGDVAAIVATFTQDFMSGGRLARATPGPHLVWSPRARDAFLERINGAVSTLDVTTEELTDHDVAAALERAAGRGVPCRIILPSAAREVAVVGAVSRAGCAVHYTDGGAMYMHEKVLVTSDGSGKTLLIGSINMSPMSLTNNRELALALDDTTARPIIDAVEATFGGDFAATVPAK